MRDKLTKQATLERLMAIEDLNLEGYRQQLRGHPQMGLLTKYSAYQDFNFAPDIDVEASRADQLSQPPQGGDLQSTVRLIKDIKQQH